MSRLSARLRRSILVVALWSLCPMAAVALDLNLAMRLAVLVELNALAHCRAPSHWVDQLSGRVDGFAEAFDALRARRDVTPGPDGWTLVPHLCMRKGDDTPASVGLPNARQITRAAEALSRLSPADASDVVEGYFKACGCQIDIRDAEALHAGFAAFVGQRLDHSPDGALASGARRTLQMRVVLWTGWAALAPRLTFDSGSGTVRLDRCPG